ncbi:hypothetical protein PMKS-002680 [Pichia membranifaciens]|uniref:Uncharacterized protein n=1 Tax=Pichia membranifaciens TaxID=4926 RepID=A0A1Q2YI26_9ASCO|nr:hypothetical protein PMKS-002680 [Pichia membranifaciens]
MYDKEADTSADTSGSFHGDNLRYNLFPDSTERLDSFDGEVDRLSDLSFRTSNTRGDDRNDFQYEQHQNEYQQAREQRQRQMMRQEGNGGGSDQEYSSSDEDDDVLRFTDSITNEFEVSAAYYNDSLQLDLTGDRPVRESDFIYSKTDRNNKGFTRKITECTKVSHLDHCNGIPLNPKDSLENYSRAEHLELNNTNVDRVLQSKDPMFAMSNQPRSKFHPSTVLDVQGLGQTKLELQPQFRSPSVYFKSNLSATYCKHGYHVLVVAIGCNVHFYDMSGVSTRDSETASSSSSFSRAYFPFIGNLNLEFRNETNMQVENSVNPLERYSINYITIKSFTDPACDTKYDVLAVCNDFSQVIVLDMKEIMDHFFSSDYKPATETETFNWLFFNDDSMVFDSVCANKENSFFRSTLKAFDKPLYVNASAWCVDICDSMVAVSDNLRRITVFQQSSIRDRKMKFESSVLSHNIPYLNIVRNGDRNYLICCGTYGSHQCILSLASKNSGEYSLQVLDVVEADGPVWTCNFVKEDDFMDVSSLKELTGDLVTDLDGQKVDKIITQSAILDADRDFAGLYSSHIGLNAYLTHLNIPSITSRHFQKKSKSKTMAVNEVYQLERVRKLYDEWYKAYKRPIGSSLRREKAKLAAAKMHEANQLFDYFIVTTTTQSVGLFLMRELINLGTCKQVFPIMDSPYIVERSNNSNDVSSSTSPSAGADVAAILGLNEYISFSSGGNRRDPIMPPRYQFLNRIYLSLPVLPLNAIVVATQAGQVAVFRLTKFNGLHSMRLESVLIDAEMYAMAQDGRLRSIIGLTGSVCGYDNSGESEWMIVVVYSDMLTLRYKLRKNKRTGEEGKLGVFSIM